MMDFLYLMAFTFHFAWMSVTHRGGEVVNSSTAFTEKMGMRRSDCIVARISSVYGQRLYGSMIAQ